MPSDSTVEDPTAFALEKHLEDFLVFNWAQTELSKNYDLVTDEGVIVAQQFASDTGPIDILAISKDKKEYLVIELKKGRTSDVVVGQTLHSITGISPIETVLWPSENTATIRIDSGPLEEKAVGSKGNGQGLVFKGSEGQSEDSATWGLMSEIASAKTFGFKAADADGYSRSVLFNVAGSVPIAAKFSVMGCTSS